MIFAAFSVQPCVGVENVIVEQSCDGADEVCLLQAQRFDAETETETETEALEALEDEVEKKKKRHKKSTKHKKKDDKKKHKGHKKKKSKSQKKKHDKKKKDKKEQKKKDDKQWKRWLSERKKDEKDFELGHHVVFDTADGTAVSANIAQIGSGKKDGQYKVDACQDKWYRREELTPVERGKWKRIRTAPLRYPGRALAVSVGTAAYVAHQNRAEDEAEEEAMVDAPLDFLKDFSLLALIVEEKLQSKAFWESLMKPKMKKDEKINLYDKVAVREGRAILAATVTNVGRGEREDQYNVNVCGSMWLPGRRLRYWE